MAFIFAGGTDDGPSRTGYVDLLMTDSQLTMYTTVWCGYCKRLKVAMKSAGISFTEVDIEHDPAAADYVMGVNGGNQTVPTLEFPDGTAMTNPSIKDIKAKLGL